MKILHHHSGLDSFSYVPERGGLITSLKLSGREILFLNEATLYDTTKNVRGGIPILFPQAGPLPEGSSFALAQHGFARNLPWLSESYQTGIEMHLKSDLSTLRVFPYDFSLKLTATFPCQGVFSLVMTVTNTGTLSLPIAPGLHPYFFLPNAQKNHLQLSWESGELKDFGFLTGETVTLKNPGYTHLKYDDGSVLTLDYSSNFNYVWIRSEIGKDFVCIEPVYGVEHSLLHAPLMLVPGSSELFEIKISLKV